MTWCVERILIIALLVLAAGPARVASAASATGTVKTAEVVAILKPQVELAAERALLAQVADLSGDAELIAQLGAIAVQDLPGLAPRRLNAAAVRAALGPIAGRLDIRGECRLSRRARTITAAELAAAAVRCATAAAGTDEVAITIAKNAGDLVVPDDGTPADLTADPLDNALSGTIPYRVRAGRGSREWARALVTLDIRRWRTVLVSARDLPRGAKLGVGDLVPGRIEVRRGGDALTDPAEAAGRALRGPLATGAVLLRNQLTARADVHGGEPVELVYRSAGIELSAGGTALADGQTGDRIQVRRGTDGKSLTGTVLGPGQVQIN